MQRQRFGRPKKEVGVSESSHGKMFKTYFAFLFMIMMVSKIKTSFAFFLKMRELVENGLSVHSFNII